MKIDLDPIVVKSLEAKWREEIERAIANAKRTGEDKAFRREWYKAEARRRWDWMRRGRSTAARTLARE